MKNIPKAQMMLIVVWAPCICSFSSELGGVGITGGVGHRWHVVGAIVSIGIALAGIVPVGADVASAMGRNTTHCHPASRGLQQ
jgi:hypothetical protein